MAAQFQALRDSVWATVGVRQALGSVRLEVVEAESLASDFAGSPEAAPRHRRR